MILWPTLRHLFYYASPSNNSFLRQSCLRSSFIYYGVKGPNEDRPLISGHQSLVCGLSSPVGEVVKDSFGGMGSKYIDN